MKNIVLTTIIISGFTMASCKKCKECHWDENGTEMEIGELCDDAIKDAEENGYNTGDTVVTIDCEEH